MCAAAQVGVWALRCLTCRIARHGDLCTGPTFNAIFGARSRIRTLKCTEICSVIIFKMNFNEKGGSAKSAPCPARSGSRKIHLL